MKTMKIFQNIRNIAAGRIQKRVRLHLSRPIHVKLRRIGIVEVESELDQQEAAVAIKVNQ